jgi:16S rRNA processing protein RimM
VPSSKSSNSWIAIGKVTRPHGVRGALKVLPYDEAADTLGEAEIVRVGGRDFTVASARRVTGGWLVELEGVTTRDLADALRGAEIEVAREDVEVGEGEYLVADLVGCEAVDSSGRSLGEVKSIFFNGAQDVLVISDELMIPLVDEWIVAVDLEARRITVESPDAV